MKTSTVVATFLSAMTFENSLKGLFLSVKKVSKLRQVQWAPILLVVVNVFGILFGPLYLVSQFTNGDCARNSLIFKINMHLFFFAFNLFLVFKTWAVAQKRVSVMVVGCLLLAHIVFWAVMDWIKSYGFQDAITGFCLYHQAQIPAFGFLLGDLLVDIFCTATTLYCAIRDVDQSSSKMQRLYNVLIADNVVRTVLILGVNTILIIYCATGALETNTNESDILLILPNLSSYVYSVALNSEFFWMSMRTAVMAGNHDD
ncbi:hypothetical protein BC830DRAFT_1124353 [Chytriomyces sp. MP71]|nr:hypothetical protein BC830DRAFT_1124353 [Chytriomyces sp. MP71]